MKNQTSQYGGYLIFAVLGQVKLSIFVVLHGSLHFKKERLSEIDLFNNEKYWSESEIANIFNTHQLVLENFFGESSRNMLLEKFKGVNKEYKWRFRYVTIIHKLWDRFGMEEELKIYILSLIHI